MTEQLTPPAAATLPVVAGWSLVDPPLIPPQVRAAAPGDTTRWDGLLHRVGTFHSASPRVSTVATDTLLLSAAACLAAGLSWTHAAFAAAVTLTGYVTQLYSDRDSVQTRGVLWYPRLLIGPLVAVAAVAVVAGAWSVSHAVTVGTVSLAALTGVRAAAWLVLVFGRRRGLGLRSALLIGGPRTTTTVWRRLTEFPEAGLRPERVMSFTDAHAPGAVARELADGGIGHVVLVAPTSDDTPLVGELPRQRDDAPYFFAVPALAELFVDPHSLVEVGGIPLIPLGRPTHRRHRLPGKRAFDVALSAALLLLALPLLLAVAVAVRLQDGGPVLFRQARTGRDGRVFRIVKFRTMVVGADQHQPSLADANVTDGLLFKLRDDPRVTPLGRLLRRTAIDELPQLWNVLRGDMSMVGPRPLAADPHDFGPAESERHSVQPGITGYWQLSGGNELSYAEMIRLDLAYIRNWSLWLDLRLVLRTIPGLLNRHGAA